MDVHVQRTDVHGHWPVRATDSTDIGLCVPRTHGRATDMPRTFPVARTFAIHVTHTPLLSTQVELRCLDFQRSPLCNLPLLRAHLRVKRHLQCFAYCFAQQNSPKKYRVTDSHFPTIKIGAITSLYLSSPTFTTPSSELPPLPRA